MDPESDTIEPAIPSGRRLRMVSRDWLLRSVTAAVDRTLIEYSRLPAAARVTIARETQRRFMALTLDRARRVRGLTRKEALRDFERAHESLMADHAEAQRELERLAARLEGARENGNVAPPAPPPVSFDSELEADLEELLRAPDTHAAIALVLAREGARRKLAVERALAEERGKVDLLERRLAKMRGELTTMEGAIVELERRASIDDGIASIYKSVQGLSPQEAQREQKRELMRKIFEANLALKNSPTPQPR